MNELNPQPAPSGEAQHIPALESQQAVLRATIHVTRKDTGKVETYELVGTQEKKES